MTIDDLVTPGEQQRIAWVTDLLARHFPNVHDGGAVSIERLLQSRTRLRMHYDPAQIRPGGTVSGPSMFKLADLSVYVVILGVLGEDAIQAVTTNMSINFLRRPKPGDLLCETRTLKLGRRLAVAEATLYSVGEDDPVAHATATYALPNR